MAKEFNDDFYSMKTNGTVYLGPHSEIQAVTLTRRKHSLDLLRKKIIGYSIEFMNGPKWHTLLLAKGYPVFPTYRYDIKEGVEYITDLRRGGTHRVIDFCGDMGNKDNVEAVYVSNLENLTKEMESLLSKSANDGLLINEPNIFFDVEIGTGVAHIVLGDLRELGYELDDFGTAPSRDEIFAHNSKVLKMHMDKLKRILVEKSGS